MTKPLIKIFIAALILKLLLAPWFYHRDLKTLNFHAQFLSQGHFNIYQYLADNRKELAYTDTFNYLPLTYLSLGSIHNILRPIFPSNLPVWLNDWSASQDNYANLPYYMLVLKLPYLFFDFGIAWLIYQLYGRKLLIFWLFNPITFYLIYILANFDIIPVFFTVLSFYLLRLRLSPWAFLCLGVATALKAYPLMFLPFFILYPDFKIKDIFSRLLYFSLPLVISIFPFLFNSNFYHSFLGSGLTQKIIEVRFFNLPLFPPMYLIIFAYYVLNRRLSLESALSLVFVLFIILVPFHAQWLLWFLPFSLIHLFSNRKQIIFLIVLSFLAISYNLLLDDQFLFWGHLIPIDPDFIYLSSPYQLIRYRLLIDPSLIQSQIKFAFSLISAIYIFLGYEKNIFSRT